MNATKRTHFLRVGVSVLFALLVLIFGAGLASAATPTVAASPAGEFPSVGVNLIPAEPNAADLCDPRRTLIQTKEADFAKGCLPLWRWKDSTSTFHSDFPTGIENWVKYVPGGTVSQLMFSLGNGMWSMTISVAEWASTFDPINMVGEEIDKGAASLGQAILDSPVLAALVVIALVFALWRAMKQGIGHSWQPVFRSLTVIAVMVAMVAGATATKKAKTCETPDGQGECQTALAPGTFSPSWFAKITKQIISASADQIATVALFSGDEVKKEGGEEETCAVYIDEMRTYYKNSFASTSIPLALDAQWRNTGLAAWRLTAFGPNAKLSKDSYCRILDWEAGITGEDQYTAMEYFDALPNGASLSTASAANESLAFGPANYRGEDLAETGDDNGKNVQNISASLVAWSACEYSGGWKVRGAWKNATQNSGNKIEDEDCEKWWSEAGAFFKKGDAFAIDRSPDQIANSIPDSKDHQEYVGYMQGVTRSGAVLTPFAYLMSSFCNLLAFGLVSIVIISAKVSLSAYALVALVVLALSLLPGQIGQGVLGTFGRKFLGASVMAWGYSVFLSIMLLLSSILSVMANDMTGGYGSVGSMIMSAVAPLLAIGLIGLLFTSLLKLPNPFSLRNIVGMGMATHALGGAVSGVRRMGRRRLHLSEGRKTRAAIAEASNSANGERGEAGQASVGGMADNIPESESVGASTNAGSVGGEGTSGGEGTKNTIDGDGSNTAGERRTVDGGSGKKTPSGNWTETAGLAAGVAAAARGHGKDLKNAVSMAGTYLKNAPLVDAVKNSALLEEIKNSEKLQWVKRDKDWAVDTAKSALSKGRAVADTVSGSKAWKVSGELVRGVGRGVGAASTKALQITTGMNPGRWQEAGVLGKAALIGRSALVGTAIAGAALATGGPGGVAIATPLIGAAARKVTRVRASHNPRVPTETIPPPTQETREQLGDKADPVQIDQDREEFDRRVADHSGGNDQDNSQPRQVPEDQGGTPTIEPVQPTQGTPKTQPSSTSGPVREGESATQPSKGKSRTPKMRPAQPAQGTPKPQPSSTPGSAHVRESGGTATKSNQPNPAVGKHQAAPVAPRRKKVLRPSAGATAKAEEDYLARAEAESLQREADRGLLPGGKPSWESSKTLKYGEK